MKVEAVSENVPSDGQSCSAAHAGGKDYRDQVTMESGGAIEMTDPDYVEDDDVKDSMAEGYF